MKKHIKSIDEKVKIYIPNSNTKNTEIIPESEEVKIYTIKTTSSTLQ